MGECQNCSNLESARIHQVRNVSETAWIGKCHNRKVSETVEIGKCRKLLGSESVGK